VIPQADKWASGFIASDLDSNSENSRNLKEETGDANAACGHAKENRGRMTNARRAVIN
jgi:hypothetical protein